MLSQQPSAAASAHSPPTLHRNLRLRHRNKMVKISVLLIIIGALIGIEATSVKRTAVAFLKSGTIEGNVTFEQEDSGPVYVVAHVTGLSDGEHGFHIHEKGDISSCSSAGGHYNPYGKHHGGPDASERHVGDLGNIISDKNNATLIITDRQLSLIGEYSIIGRAVVVHELKDDLGLGNATDSKTTGAAGSRLACGVIGIKDPIDNWNSPTSDSSTISLLSMSTLSIVAAILSTL